MPISPSIPTSFVPKQSIAGGNKRPMSSGNNILLLISIIILGLSVVAAGGVFGYEKILEGQEQQKEQELAKAQAGIDQNQIEGYIRLKKRIDASKDILNKHILMSQFFDALEANTVQTVRFNDMNLTIADDRSAKVILNGSAKTFNALAAESQAFASVKYFKRAIFGNISLNPKDNSVNFSLSADVDPSLFAWAAATTVLPPASSLTAASTTTTAATGTKP